jgi:hypothetical protein
MYRHACVTQQAMSSDIGSTQMDSTHFYGVITNYVSDYIYLLVRIAHIIFNQPLDYFVKVASTLFM